MHVLRQESKKPRELLKPCSIVPMIPWLSWLSHKPTAQMSHLLQLHARMSSKNAWKISKVMSDIAENVNVVVLKRLARIFYLWWRSMTFKFFLQLWIRLVGVRVGQFHFALVLWPVWNTTGNFINHNSGGMTCLYDTYAYTNFIYWSVVIWKLTVREHISFANLY